MEREDDDRKLSFSYDIREEKLGLIDVSKEDDLLIDSPLFNSLEDLRLSVSFDGTNEHEAIRLLGPHSSEGESTEETILQKGQNLSPSGAMEPVRPSYLRKSLAWDSAFFNSAGVLDPDELTFINRGLNAVEDIHMRRAETKSTVKGSGKLDICHQNKIKIKLASQRHRIRISEKTKIEHDSRREEAPAKASDQMKNLLRGQSISASLNAYDVQIDNKSAIRSGKDMMLCKKSELVNSCSLPSGYLSSPTFSSAFSFSTNDTLVSSSSYDTSLCDSSSKVPSALVKGKTESRKTKLCSSNSTSETPRLPKKSKASGHPRFSTFSKSISNNFTCISLASSSDATFSKSISRSKQQPNDLEAHVETSVVWRTGLQSGVLQGPNTPNISHRKSSLSLQCEEIKSPAQVGTEALLSTCLCPNSTEPRKKFKPSGLRQPSPKIGFFDEEKTVLTTANGGLQFRYEMEITSPYEYGSINRKRPAKLLPDKTSPKTKTLKHSPSHLLHSAPGIKGRKASSDKKLWSSSTRVSSTMKNWSDVAWRLNTHNSVATEEEICSKSRKVDARECDRKRVAQTSDLKGDDQRRVEGRLKKRLGIENKGQKDDIRIQRELRNYSMEEKNASQQTIVDNLHLLNEDKTRTSTNWEDQVNDLRRYFDVIDLNEDMLMEFKGNKDPACSQNTDSIQNHVDINSPTFDRKNILDGQQQDLKNISPIPSQPSLSITDILPSSRTPLADKTSACNRNGSFKSSLESTKGKLMAKALAVSSFEGIDKENI